MLLALLLVLAVDPSTGVDKKEQDRTAILAMAGTYNVSFHFEETVAFQPGYQLKDPYQSGALETVIVVENSEDKIVLQHVLQTQRGIVKHWRQDWEFENRELWEFMGDRTWRKRVLPAEVVRGTWTQRVFQVDDSPRYESYGSWTHVGNLSQWQSEKTNRPLPRREYTKRDDYDILVAVNRHTLTLNGWVHEQDNYKLRTGEGTPFIIAREQGLNRYDLTQPRHLAEAEAWWEERKTYWQDVRQAWRHVFEKNEEISLAATVEDKPLYRHIFNLGDEAFESGTYNAEKAKPQIRKIIEDFMTPAKEDEAAY